MVLGDDCGVWGIVGAFTCREREYIEGSFYGLL